MGYEEVKTDYKFLSRCMAVRKIRGIRQREKQIKDERWIFPLNTAWMHTRY